MTAEKYPIERGLDGMYFRVERDGEWKDICLTDLIPEEREVVLNSFDKDSKGKSLVFASKLNTEGILIELDLKNAKSDKASH